VFSHHRPYPPRIPAGVAYGACLLLSLAAYSSPTKPSASVASGRPVSPINGTQFSYYSQPITLVVANGVATGGGSPTTAVEVATDATFTAVVTTQAASPDANGRLFVTLAHLSPATTYYWRVKTAAGDNPGVYSAPASFSIGPQLVIQAPVPVQPLAGSLQDKRPTFVVTNAVRTGPAATVMYRFEIATDTEFHAIVTSGSVPEGPSQTSFTPSSDFVSGGTLYWHAEASDRVTNVTSAYSTPQRFVTFAPNDGVWPYRLTIQAPDVCRGYSAGVSNGLIGPFRFDGRLTVVDHALKFRLGPGAGDLAVMITRTGDRLSGSVKTATGPPRINDTYFQVYSTALSGTASVGGRLGGTFDGWVQVANVDAEWAQYCNITGFPWTLAPIN
jgi:hypothetical protein